MSTASPAQTTTGVGPLPGAGARFSPRWWWELLRSAAVDWWDDNVPRLGAALAYYTIFSLAPLLLIGVSIAGMVFGAEAAQAGMRHELELLLGADGAGVVQDMVAATNKQGANTLATIIGFAVLLFGASGVFGELQSSLNIIWEAKPPQQSGVWSFLRYRLLSFAMVLAVGFLLLVSLVLNTVLALVGNWLGGLIGAEGWIFPTIETVSTMLVVILLFAMIFKFLPDKQIAWRDVWVGAIATAVLFSIGKFLIGLYLGQAAFTSTYGAAGSILVVLLWIYYSAQIVFFGAELTQAYTHLSGHDRDAANIR